MLETIFENENYFIFNKSAGLLTHPDGHSKQKSFLELIAIQYPELENIGDKIVLSINKEIKRFGLAHRLDKETSGCLIVCKNQKSFLNIKKQFQANQIKKIYLAFSYGEVKKDFGLIDAPLGRGKDFRKKTTSLKAKKMKEARTEFVVLDRKNNFSFLKILPETGRNHQVRAHFKYLGYPLVSDPLYSKGLFQPANLEKNLFFTRTALHCFSLEFLDLNGEKIKVKADLPIDFKKALDYLKIIRKSY